MPTVIHTTISSSTSSIIQRWIKEVNLHKVDGSLISLPQACEIILEDFAEGLAMDEQQFNQQQQEYQRIKGYTK